MNRTFKYLFILSAFLLASSISLKAQTDPDETQQTAMADFLNEGFFTIDVDYVLPAGAREIKLRPNFMITLKKNEVFVRLPHHGRSAAPNFSYSMPNLDFEGDVTDYKFDSILKGRRSRTEIYFRTSDMGETYTFRITVFPDGESRIYLSSNYKSPINYRGDVRIETEVSE